jgi:hypothetical protein
MAGQLTIDTLKASSGVLATQNGMTGIAKAWVNFNGTGTVAIRDSFNVSSITDNGAGDYTVNFTTAMANANYSYNVSANYQGGWPTPALNVQTGGTEVAPTTSAFRFSIGVNTTLTDMKYINVIVCGS